MHHYVPPAKHKKGETVKFEKFAAEIPQVEGNAGLLLDADLRARRRELC